MFNPVEEKAIALYRERFGAAPSQVSLAPGRVEILGNHTDYNEGYVMPMALDRCTALAVGEVPGSLCSLVSDSFEGMASFDLTSVAKGDEARWSDYTQGVAIQLQRQGVVLKGCRGAVCSDVPVAAGLSSSAALEVASCLALLALSGRTLDRLAMARLCQRAENEFVGVRCGILDQFSSLFGQPGCALFLDCRTLENAVLPLQGSSLALVICNTLEKHTLISSKYNDRRQECEGAASLLSQWDRNVLALRDVSEVLLRDHERDLAPDALKRAQHVVGENGRVLEGREALRAGQTARLGALMFQSHESSRDLFENSTPKLDFLVERSRHLKGVLGAKLCGGGFGGCTVHLVSSEEQDAVARSLSSAYEAWAGKTPEVYQAGIGGGAGVKEI